MFPLSAPTYTIASTSSANYDAPAYSSEAALDERTLDRTLLCYRPIPTGIYSQADGNLSLTLKEQVDGTKMPSYGRHGLVKGDIMLNRPQGIVAIKLKLDGNLEVTLGGIGKPVATTFFSMTQTLWKTSDTDTSPSSCPSALTFEIKIPATYRGRDLKTYPLPPSCDISLPDGDPVGSISCKYTLTVSASKAPRLAILKRQKSFRVDFDYNPQSLPPTPPLPSHLSFVETVASAPEAWYDVTSTMQARSASGIKPIQCHLYIPSTQIYGLSTSIPFHLQLVAPSASLRSLYTHTSAKASTKSPVRVCLMRHITANSYGNKVRRVFAIGEGDLWPLPPLGLGGKEDALRWDGRLRCDRDVEVGGFSVDDVLSIKDYIVLSVYPPHPTSSPLVEVQHKHPIRLVADRRSKNMDLSRARS